MRIAFVHPRFPSAEGTGATHSATQIVNGLDDAGHDLCVYCPTFPDEPMDDDGPDLVHLTGNSDHPHSNTRLNRELSARADELRQFDVVHSYVTPMLPAIAEIGEDADVATVVTLNAYKGTCAKNDLLYLDERQCHSKSTLKCLHCITRTGFEGGPTGYLRQTVGQSFSLRLINDGESRLEHVDAFRAPSGHVRDNYAEFGFPAERIHVIPHPLDDKFLVEHTSDFQEPIDLLYVGYLEHQKGVDNLVPILSGLRRTGIDATLTVVGDGEKRTKMERQAKDAAVEQWIDFRGRLPNADLPKVYAAHDLLIHPSTWEEPLARVYIEALATGTPIVTREYGSIQKIIGDGGITVDGSVGDFQRAIADLVRNGGLEDLSEGGQSKIDDYRLESVIDQVCSTYEKLV